MWVAVLSCAGWGLLAFAQGGGAGLDANDPESEATPNVVIILADDLGWGDVGAMHPESAIATPSMDRLAEEGMRFTDAHSPAAVCTPTRYGLLTGRYSWRTRLARGVLNGYSPPLIETDRPTLGTLLQAQGYRTAAVGKWHLGMDMRRDSFGDVDFRARIADSPIHHGFDAYFGVSASLDMPPYVWIRNDRFTAVPTRWQFAQSFPLFIRSGLRAEDFVIDEVLDRLVEEAVDFIDRASQTDDPFFLYLPLTAPHAPAAPHARFRGRTGLGEYGDFVAQVDDAVGQVLEALDEAGAADETLVFFTSDNGSYMRRRDDTEPDHVTRSSINGYRAGRHRSNADWRGHKGNIWEGGHRVPFVVRWPGVVGAGTETAATVVHTDLYATLADVVGVTLEPEVAPDSVSLLPMLRGEAATRGVPVVHHSYGGVFAIRHGPWKLVLGTGSGGRQLFNLSRDPVEAHDVSAQQPGVAEQLEAAFERFRSTGRSAAAPVPNGSPVALESPGALTLYLGSSVAVDLSGAFSDPDGDALTYSAVSSSSPSVATATVSGSVLTVTAVSVGAATVTVTATDAGGSNTAASQRFAVTVLNNPPAVVGSLPALALREENAAATVDLSGAFSDPDGDELTYSAVSSSPSVATATVSGSVLTVTAVSVGAATVTAAATDAGGSNTAASQRFVVRVLNDPPVAVGALPALVLTSDAAAVDLSGAFSDPDGDALTYSAVSSSPAVAAVSVSGSVLTVTWVSVGETTVTVTAADIGGRGGSAVQRFVVTVANRSPVAVGTLSPLTLSLTSPAPAVDLSGAFSDPDGDALTYSAVSSSPAVATVEISGPVLTVTAVSAGAATVTVTATDASGSGMSAEQSFGVTVTASDYDLDGDGLIEIRTLGQLDAVRHDVDGDGAATSAGASEHAAAFPDALEGLGCPASGCTGYELASDLDFDTNGNGVSDAGDAWWNGGAGWSPIGSEGSPFAATFDGNHHELRGLHVAGGRRLGLFGVTASSSAIRRVGLVGVSVRGETVVGGLVGLHRGLVDWSYATGSVGGSSAGGLVGENHGSIRRSYSTARVVGGSRAGGLVGSSRGGWVGLSYATGYVSGADVVGGLVGDNRDADIVASYATGRVTGAGAVGGLVGAHAGGSVTSSFWDEETSGQATGAAGEGVLTSGLMSGSFRTWWAVNHDGEWLASVWMLDGSRSYPALWTRLANGDWSWTDFGYQVRTAPAVTATADAGGVLVSWTAVEVSDWEPAPAVTYAVYRTAGTVVERLATGVAERTYTDATASGGETYRYQVAAEVSGGEPTRSRLGGMEGAATVTVPVPVNGPPAPSGSLPGLTLPVSGGAAAVEASGAFIGSAGDVLTHEALSLAPEVAGVSVSGSTVTRRPNILFLFTDDQRRDTIRAWGNPRIETPALDRLADEGFSFRNAYNFGSHSTAVCVPSRAMLLTGRSWIRSPSPTAMDGLAILPEMLSDAGYRTFVTGKWHPEQSAALLRGFDSGRSLMLAPMADHTRVPIRDLEGGRLVRSRDGHRFSPLFSSVKFAGSALEFLDEQAASDKPFFAFVSFSAPHDPRNPPLAHRRRYYSADLPLPPNFLPQHPFDIGTLTIRGEHLDAWPRRPEAIRDQIAEYYGLITHLDTQVGRILDALARNGLADDTIVVYASDNGLDLGGHGLLAKGSLYEDAVSVPLIIKGPGIPQGSTDAFAYVHDLFPTLLGFAGVEPPSDVVDGSDLSVLWSDDDGDGDSWRESVFLAYRERIRAVRGERYKLIVYPRINHSQLFDLAEDPHETENLADLPEHAATVTRLRELMGQWRTAQGDEAPLEVTDPLPFHLDLTGHEPRDRRRQPAWILDKYFEPQVTLVERHDPALEATDADTLAWRIRFRRTVTDVDAADFRLGGEHLGAPTITVTAVADEPREYYVAASGGNLADLQDVTVTLEFSDAYSIRDPDGGNVPRSWPPEGERTYTVSQPVANRGPEAAGTLPELTLLVTDGAESVEVSGAFSDADGDELTYAVSSSSPAVATASLSGSTVTVTPVSAGEATVTVTATDAGGSNASAVQAFAVRVSAVDYDADDDGLVEIATLSQLDAVRHDLDGDGAASAAGAAAYASAFPGAVSGMGCPAPGCGGYELAADLDLDTNGNGVADAGDGWWNAGSGWVPIGSSAAPFTSAFAGNGRTVSHLFANRGAGDYVGLFGMSRGTITGVGVVEADVTGRSYVGGLLGKNEGGEVRASYSTGRVAGYSVVGGLVGLNGLEIRRGGPGQARWVSRTGALRASYSTAAVSADFRVGGLVGYNLATIAASYATGSVAAGATQAPRLESSAGGLVGWGASLGEVRASYSTGRVSGRGRHVGGLIGNRLSGHETTASYWDRDTSGVVASGGGSGHATSALQGPTAYTGLYASWDVDVDGDGAADRVWDFGTSSEYPALSVDVDGDGTATWRELGLQGRTASSAPVSPVLETAESSDASEPASPVSETASSGEVASGSRGPVAFTDDPLVAGVTPVRAVHLTELRSRVDGLRAGLGLPAFVWTDAAVVAGVTPARAAHLTELRTALAEAHASAGRSAPVYTDTAVTSGVTPMKAAQLQELRAAVAALEAAR